MKIVGEKKKNIFLSLIEWKLWISVIYFQFDNCFIIQTQILNNDENDKHSEYRSNDGWNHSS